MSSSTTKTGSPSANVAVRLSRQRDPQPRLVSRSSSCDASSGVPHHGHACSWTGFSFSTVLPVAEPVERCRVPRQVVRRARPARPRARSRSRRLPEPRRPRADRLAAADQERGPLELLDREQPQRVAHQHGHARSAVAVAQPSQEDVNAISPRYASVLPPPVGNQSRSAISPIRVRRGRRCPRDTAG